MQRLGSPERKLGMDPRRGHGSIQLLELALSSRGIPEFRPDFEADRRSSWKQWRDKGD